MVLNAEKLAFGTIKRTFEQPLTTEAYPRYFLHCLVHVNGCRKRDFKINAKLRWHAARPYARYAWTLHYTILIDAQIYTYENLKQASKRIMHRSSHAFSPVESNYSPFNVTKCTVEISHKNYYGKIHKKINTFCVYNVVHNHLQWLFKNIQRNKVNFVK